MFYNYLNYLDYIDFKSKNRSEFFRNLCNVRNIGFFILNISVFLTDIIILFSIIILVFCCWQIIGNWFNNYFCFWSNLFFNI